MKVHELIEALKEMPQDAEIIAYSEQEIVSFEIEDVKAYKNKVYAGYIYEDYSISQAELYVEYENNKGKLKEFWRRMYHGSGGFYHDNVNGKRISIIPSFRETLTGETVNFAIEENGKTYYPTDFTEVKAFVEKYIDFLMDGVNYDYDD